MFDGATDKSVCEVELVYVRYVIGGQARNQYLLCQPIEHAHADGIFGAIDQAFRDVGVENWRSKVVGVGCDGASVNLGRNNSVATRITENMNYIVLMHCVAHRLELGIDFHRMRYISYSCVMYDQICITIKTAIINASIKKIVNSSKYKMLILFNQNNHIQW